MSTTAVPPATTPAPVVGALVAALPAGRVLDDPDVLASYAHDEAEWAPHALPAAVVRPRTAEEVQAVVRACLEHRVPVVPRGAGTGLSGGANAVEGSVVVSIEHMTEIVEIDGPNGWPWSSPASSTTTCAPPAPSTGSGTRRTRPARPGRPSAATSPPTPAGCAASSTASPATTCSAMQVVDRRSASSCGSGGGRPRASPGYDLAGLMVGSEGTLGVVTEVTVRLRPRPPGPERTVAAYFDSVVAAGHAVAARHRGRAASRRRWSWSTGTACEAVDEWKNMGLARPTPTACCSPGSTPPARPATPRRATMLAPLRAAPAPRGRRGRTDAEEAEALFAARRLAYPALERLGPVLTEDVCVPRVGGPGDARPRSRRSRRATTSSIANIAHAGDGNLHPLLITPPGDEAARARARRPRSRRSSPPPSSSAARSPASTASACSSAAACSASCRPRCWRCTGRSRPPSTRTACSTPARCCSCSASGAAARAAPTMWRSWR